jgi:transcriptional regulator with XRE-family HTH domain
MMRDMYSMTDPDIAATLGMRLRALRLRKNRTLTDVAQQAMIGKNTLTALEAGRGKLETLIAVLRELNALDALNDFLPEPPPSPIAIANAPKRRLRLRASPKKSPRIKKPTREEDAW